MDLSLVVFIILAVISMILGVIILVSHVMELRDRPGLFIFGVLCIAAAVVFFILVLVTPKGQAAVTFSTAGPVCPLIRILKWRDTNTNPPVEDDVSLQAA